MQAQAEGRSQNWLLLESVFWKFAESKPAEDLGPDFQPIYLLLLVLWRKVIKLKKDLSYQERGLRGTFDQMS